MRFGYVHVFQLPNFTSFVDPPFEFDPGPPAALVFVVLKIKCVPQVDNPERARIVRRVHRTVVYGETNNRFPNMGYNLPKTVGGQKPN
jgi:hypothetical protein